jgi:formate C-acetyltransferase
VSDRDVWLGFTGTAWRVAIDVPDFVQHNYTPYTGDAAFLAGPTPRTTKPWESLAESFAQERERGIYDVDVHHPASITAHAPG